MNKIYAVIRREFIARVRTRAFILSTLLVPVLMVGMGVLEVLVFTSSTHETTHIALVDATSQQVGPQVAEALNAETLGSGSDVKPRYDVQVFPAQDDSEAVRDRLVSKVDVASSDNAGEKDFDGVLVLHQDLLADGKADYYGDNVGSMNSMQKLRSSLSHALTTQRLASSGISPKVVAHAIEPAHLQTSKVSKGKLTGESGVASAILAYIMIFILYMAILIYGQQTMTSVVEEKTSRVMEVLASSLTPFQMLLGKVVGVGSAGLLQLAIWIGSIFIITTQGVVLASMFGADPSALANLPIPSMSVGLLVVFLLYFVLGFLLFGALYAAIGSMCNTVQETQQYAIVVMVPIFVGFLSAFKITNNPDGTLGAGLSLVPFLSPFTMPVRWSMTSVPWPQLAASLLLAVATLLGCVWLAGRIYRTGILMYGKKPGMKELWRWLRAG